MEKENTIILKAKGELIDEDARNYCSIIDTRLETINKRTKSHTMDIKNCIKRIEELEKSQSQPSGKEVKE